MTLEDGYEYKWPIEDEKCHGLGNLSMTIAGLKEIDNPCVGKDALQLVGLYWRSMQHD